MLVSSGGCSRDELVPVLRGSEVVFRARRMSGSALPSTGSGPELAEGSLSKGRVFLEVELSEGQEAEDVHREGWYVSSAQMSRIFERLGEEAPGDSAPARRAHRVSRRRGASIGPGCLSRVRSKSRHGSNLGRPP